MITFTSITKRYGAITAVDNVSFTVNKGEFFALLGPNGAGKTTLVKLLMDFCRPTTGSVTIDGISSTSPNARNGIGYLAENHRIPPHLTGLEYLQRQAELSGLSRNQAAGEIQALLQEIGMAGKERLKSRTYSKGMTQRIGLAAAMIGNPKLLVLDEPSSGLDPIGIREVRKTLERLQKRGATIILNSHLLSEVEKTCTTAAIIDKGRIIVKDEISKIVNEGESLEDVFVRLVQGNR
jgi:ABC-2 type transport system ATP-binding protein